MNQPRLQGKAQTQTVTRSTCISFECYPGMLLEDDLLDDSEDEEGEEDPLEILISGAYAHHN